MSGEVKCIHDVSFKHLSNDPIEGIMSCGFLPKKPEVKAHNFTYYGGFVVLSGKGAYINEKGETFEIGVGDFVQRQPGVIHTTKVYPGEPWFEFYVCFGKQLYETLVLIGAISKEPIIKIQMNDELVKACELLLYKYKKSGDKDLNSLLLSTQSFLFYVNDLSRELASVDGDSRLIELICDELSKDFEKVIDVKVLASQYQVGYERLRKLFKKHTGNSVYHYRIMKRMNEGKRLLCYQELTLKHIAAQLGFTDQYAFSNQFKKITGMSPKVFRQQL